MVKDETKVYGRYIIEVIRDGKDGPVTISREETPNRVLNTGKTETWRAAAGLSTTIWDHMRIGTSGATTSSAQTNLLSPITGTNKTVDSATMDGRTLQLVYSYPSGGGSKSATNIQEVCILNEATSPGGDALNRSLFTAVNKTTSDKLKITYQIRIS